MKRRAKWIIVALAPLLMAALGMEKQASFKPQEAPLLSPPAVAVPTTGKEIVSWQSRLENNVPADTESVNRGKALYTVNCRMCHGHQNGVPGPVGKHLTPPPR